MLRSKPPALWPALLTLALAAPLQAQTTSDRVEVLADVHGYYPCMDCHGDQVTIPTPRILEEEHHEPLIWTDEEGNERSVSFGERVAIADLLESARPGQLRSDKLASVGQSISIERYMEFNGLAPEDSVWVMVHGGGNIWCLNCHHQEDMDKLVKLNGQTLTFNQSHLLCGECHGQILTDWELGIHGKTTGHWNLAGDGAVASNMMLCVECHNPHAPAFPSMEALPPPVTRLPWRGAGGAGHHHDADDHAEEEGAHE